jgi:hypothetical protein
MPLVSRKQILGLAGSVVLFVGVFAPIVSLPIVGSVNYFQNGRGDGVIVLILAVISLVLVLLKRYRWLWITGLLSLGMLVFTFINFRMRMSQMTADMETKLANNPFKGIASTAMQSVQIQWGWALLIVGAGLLIAAAAVKEPNSSSRVT